MQLSLPFVLPKELANIWSDKNLLAQMLRFSQALAIANAKVGLLDEKIVQDLNKKLAKINLCLMIFMTP